FPPYIEPWDPNIDPLLTSAVNMLGSYMAAELTAEGKKGVVIQGIYDAYTPARAYQHYHAGARILSETASANLASPVTVDPERLRGGRGYDAGQRSWNYPAPWTGGAWGLPDITAYMEAGALALLTNAAHNRRFWVDNFAAINRRAVEGWRDDWPAAWVIPAGQDNQTGVDNVVWILRMGDVEVHRAAEPFSAGGRRFPAGSLVIPDGQPYFGFAHTLLDRQEYPDLRQYPGGPPQPPYDVTAHTLPLLMDVEAVALEDAPGVALSEPVPLPDVRYRAPGWLRGPDAPRIALYKSWQEPMTEGWTRWVLDQHGVAYDTLHDADIRGGALARYDVLLLEDQGAGSIREGWAAGRMPEEFTGGLGAEGTAAVERFVRAGGRLVAIGAATEFAAQALGLPLENAVEGLPSSEFYVPGSILGLDLAPGALGGAPAPPGVWFWRSSRAFEARPGLEVLARYAADPLRSGWALGQERIAGQPALVRAEVGEGDAVLFGFPPNYRGQTVGTWPLLFAALGGR
ncbi:MAG TPA: hypothetical protein VMK65_10885, partial [Longimicrobiales bacterium]|nr:hypothetical protein [Longimicrobiales bacterium]